MSRIVCPGELEASITELRLIHHHLPRYNRVSKPAKANHFVTLTNEEFPRLSMTRTIDEDSPFVSRSVSQSQATAQLVMHAIWDATRIRRCTGKPGRRSGRGAMDSPALPCARATARSQQQPEYAPELTPLTEAISGRRKHALLDPLVDRMRQQMMELRYEEAAWTRDRYRALVLCAATPPTVD